MNKSRQQVRAPESRPAPQPGTTVELKHSEYSGQIPPPHLLRDFDDLIPGTAARIIQWAEDEQRHRHNLERSAQAANIHAQRQQLVTVDYQTRAVVRSGATCSANPLGSSFALDAPGALYGPAYKVTPPSR